MKCTWIWAAIVSLPLAVTAQIAPPVGTLLPVTLDKSLNINKVHAGQEIRAEVMQNIPGTKIRRRDHVLGHVVNATPLRNGPSILEICFDAVQVHGRRIPIKTNLRALASFIEVEEAQIPEEMASRGITPEVATTQQIGGDQVYRGGGPVTDGKMTVGQPTPYGVLALLRVQPGQPCRGDVGDSSQPQALWLFSTDACGVYGLSNIRIKQAGRTDPAGDIILASDGGKLNLQGGTGLLLRVKGS
jgi:hypothetical protein